jgi:hypothetical protein
MTWQMFQISMVALSRLDDILAFKRQHHYIRYCVLVSACLHVRYAHCQEVLHKIIILWTQ